MGGGGGGARLRIRIIGGGGGGGGAGGATKLLAGWKQTEVSSQLKVWPSPLAPPPIF